MKRVLVTGGPVHAHLDAVKIVTNTFMGGTIAAFAEHLCQFDDLDVTYLCAKGSVEPTTHFKHIPQIRACKVVHHNGYDDYRDKVLEYAKTFDAIILGAAVANLIPAKPWKEKFPSHDYKEGDLIDIPFMIAPRVINMVKKVNPRITLIGYKLLSNVPEQELIRAAKEVLVGSKADCVLANMKENLGEKIAITKEFGTHRLKAAFKHPYKKEDDDVDVNFVHAMIMDEHYQTLFYNGAISEQTSEAISVAEKKAREFLSCDFMKKWLVPNEYGYIFGTVAVRAQGCQNIFVTTTRGKKDLNTLVTVLGVDHKYKAVKTYENKAVGGIKPTLNAPLLHHIFSTRPDVNAILHYHMLPKYGMPKMNDEWIGNVEYTLPWAPPGTVRDSIRDLSSEIVREKINGDMLDAEKRDIFFIEGHGAFILIKDGDKPVDQGNIV